MPPQKIKTFYKPSTSAYDKPDSEIVKQHEDRRALNRQRRDEQRVEQSSFAGKVKGAAMNVLGKAKTFAESHPINNERKPKRESRERDTSRKGRVSRVDKYEDGKVKETIYFSTHEAIPKKPRTKPSKHRLFARGWGLGDVGAGMNMRDFIPQGMGMGSPSRKKSKRSGSGDWSDPGYIPPSLRDFF